MLQEDDGMSLTLKGIDTSYSVVHRLVHKGQLADSQLARDLTIVVCTIWSESRGGLNLNVSGG